MTDGLGSASQSLRRRVAITNTKGLHARAAAKFVKTAARFNANILVMRDGAAVSGRSIMGLMTLAAGLGTEIEIVARGGDAAAALAALVELVERKFDEEA